MNSAAGLRAPYPLTTRCYKSLLETSFQYRTQTSKLHTMAKRYEAGRVSTSRSKFYTRPRHPDNPNVLPQLSMKANRNYSAMAGNQANLVPNAPQESHESGPIAKTSIDNATPNDTSVSTASADIPHEPFDAAEGILNDVNDATSGQGIHVDKATEKPKKNDIKSQTEQNEDPSEPKDSLENEIENITAKIDLSYIKECVSSIQDHKKIFISLDLEQYERKTSIVTEIGISIYQPPNLTDTTKVSSRPLVPEVRATHVVVKENMKFRNGRFVPDNRDRFAYGETVVLPHHECLDLFKRIFSWAAETENFHKSTSRQVVIVGHNVKGDISALKKFGVKFPANHSILDTEKAWRGTRVLGPSNLGFLLTFFRVPHQYLHNAGNDAYLTLLLTLKLCDPSVRESFQLDVPPTLSEIKSYPPKKGPRGKRNESRNRAPSPKPTHLDVSRSLTEF